MQLDYTSAYMLHNDDTAIIFAAMQVYHVHICPLYGITLDCYVRVRQSFLAKTFVSCSLSGITPSADTNEDLLKLVQITSH